MLMRIRNRNFENGEIHGEKDVWSTVQRYEELRAKCR